MKNTLIVVASLRIYLVDRALPFPTTTWICSSQYSLRLPGPLGSERFLTRTFSPGSKIVPWALWSWNEFSLRARERPFSASKEHEEQLCISVTKAEWLSFTDPGEECQQVNVVFVPTKETMGSRLLIRAFCICALTTLGVTDAVHHTFLRVEFLAIPEGSC